MRDLTEREREIGEIVRMIGGFHVIVDRAQPPGSARIVSMAGVFRHEISHTGTIEECHAWLIGWKDREGYDQPDLLMLGAEEAQVVGFFDAPQIQLTFMRDNTDRPDVREELMFRTRGALSYGYDREKFERLLATVELRHPPFPIELIVQDHFTHGFFIVACYVPDRSTGDQNVIYHQYSVPDPFYRDWLTWIYECVQLAVLHEIAETFHHGGVRFRDPHR